MRFAYAAATGLLLVTTLSVSRAQDRPAPVPSDSPVPAVNQAPLGLAELVERAWRSSRQGAAKEARADELSAREATTRTFFAGAGGDSTLGLEVNFEDERAPCDCC